MAHPRVTGWHYVTVGMATGLVLASGIYLSVRLVRATSGSDDDSLALAVFPFRPTSSTSVDWSEATADLLTVTLDGTAGLRVLDPWALWRGLRPERSARAETPDPVDAARLATEAGANRFLLGSVIESGDRLDLSVRIYDVASPEPLVTLSVGGSADELADLIQQLAVDVLTRIWRGGAAPRVQELDRVATQSPEALKAYLEAKEAMRRGLVDPAEEAIDRALALDSTFALALVEAVNLKSWVQFMRAELFTGLLDLAQQALVHGDSLSPRNRLRAEAVLASVRTDGARAASNAERIIALDSTDIGAWQVLSYYHRAYGWQYGATTADAIEAAERALGLDPTYTPVLHARAWLSSGTGDAADMRRQIERLEDAEFSALPIQATILGLKAHLASPGEFATLLDGVSDEPFPIWSSVFRLVRRGNLARAQELIERRVQTLPPREQASLTPSRIRLYLAAGRLAEVDSMIPSLDLPEASRSNLDQFLVTASLTGLGEPTVARRAIADLTRYTPPDSLLANFNDRSTWVVAWAVGGHEAAFGDTATARVWQRAVGTLPRGGTSADYVASIQSDIESRLAFRRGDMNEALIAAKRAFELWSIHTDNMIENYPEPGIRFNLGQMYRRSGEPDSAQAIFRSMTPPTTWMGYLSPLATLELAEIAVEQGRGDEAARYYGRVLEMLEGTPEPNELRVRAREGLSGVNAGSR